MVAIVTRVGKGSPLTNVEVDTNFTNLNAGKLEVGQAQTGVTENSVLFFNGSGVLSAGTGLTFNGTTLTANTFAGALSGNASTATALQTARLIGGVSFDGTANINLPGVNTAGNQNTSGNAATATTLATARTINGTSFNGSADITTANWGTARTLTIGNTGKSVNGGANVSWTLGEIGAPSTTGAGASGTWGINITGNAATVTNGVYQNQYGSFQASFTVDINANTNRNAGVFGSYAAGATNTPTNAGLLWNATSGTDGSGDGAQIWQDYVTNNLYARQRWGGGWSAWLTILSSNNFANFAVNKAGDTMTGALRVARGTQGQRDAHNIHVTGGINDGNFDAITWTQGGDANTVNAILGSLRGRYTNQGRAELEWWSRTEIEKTSGGAPYLRVDQNGRVTMPFQPAFRAVLAANHFLAGASVNGDVGGSWNAPVNVGGHYNTSTRRFTAPVSGSYAFTAIIATFGGTGGFSYLSAEIWVNGSRVFIGGWGAGGAGGSYGETCSSSVIYLNAGDYVTLGCETSKSFTMQAAAHTSLSGHLIG